MTARALIIGLDGADRNLIAQWCDDGSLPTLRSLRDRGLFGLTTTPAGLGDDAIWADFYSGNPVGEHGRYYWNQPTADGLKLAPARQRPVTVPPFWQRLSDSGRKVAVIDVPKCPVATRLNGIQLCDWLAHGRDYPTPASHPPTLAAEVIERFGMAPPSNCGQRFEHYSHEMIEDLRVNLLRSAAMKGAALRHFLAQDSWDLLVGAFKEAHCATHRLWHLVDAEHASYCRGADEQLGRPLRAVYQAVDRALGEIVQSAGPQASLLVFTTLQMAANVSGNHALGELAARINRAHADRRDRVRETFSGLVHRHRTWRSAVCRKVPHNEMSGAVRLNVVGRDPGGRVRPGTEYEALLTEIAGDLRELADPATGRRLVTQVLLAGRDFPGPQSSQLPDLLVVWDRSRPIDSVHSPRYGTVPGSVDPRQRSGNHVPGGAFLLAGPAARHWPQDDEPVPLSRLAGRFLAACDRLSTAAVTA